MKNKTIALRAAAAAATLAVSLSACSTNKAKQVYNDAPRTAAQNNAPAQIIAEPDGFSNVAAKCDGPNMLYVIFHNDSAYGSVAVAPNDPRCTAVAAQR